MDGLVSPYPAADWGAWETNGNMGPPIETAPPPVPLADPVKMAQLRATMAAFPPAATTSLAPTASQTEPAPMDPMGDNAAFTTPYGTSEQGGIKAPAAALLANGRELFPSSPPPPAPPPTQVASDRASGNYDVTTPAAPKAAPAAAPGGFAPVTPMEGAPSIAGGSGDTSAPSPERVAAMSAPYKMGAGYYDLVHAGEGNGTNPITKASGPVQVMPKTADEFHASPGNAKVDINTPEGAAKFTQWYGDQNAAKAQSITGQPATNAQVLAGHLLGPDGMAAILAHPNEPAGKYLIPAVFTNNPGPLPGGPNATGAQTLASIANYYAGARGGGASGGASPSQVGQTGVAGSIGMVGQPGTAGAGAPPFQQMPLPYDPSSLTMRGAPLLALAGGILSGRGLGDGLGRGLTAMSQVQQEEVKNKMAANNMVMQLNHLGIQQQYQNAMLGVRNRTVDNAVNRTNNAANPTLVGDLATARAGGGLNVKEAGAAAQSIIQDGQQATVRNTQLDAIQKLLDSGQVTPGPGLNALKRNLGNMFGISIAGSEPNANQLLESAVSAERGNGIMGKNMRTQLEYNNLLSGLGNVEHQGPEAMKQVITSLRNINNMKLQMAQAWDQLGQNDPALQRQYRTDPDAMAHWMNGVLANWDQQVQKSGGQYGQNVPGNIGYSSKDPHTGLGFTIH